jgi:hypothetical protein
VGRAIVVIIGAIAELERGLIVERGNGVRAGMRRARLDGQRIGQPAAGSWYRTVLPSNKSAGAASACKRSQRPSRFGGDNPTRAPKACPTIKESRTINYIDQ